MAALRPPAGGRAGAGQGQGWTGAVLTGGASRRMGVDKSLLEVGGRPLASIAGDALREAGAARVLAVGGNAPALRLAGFEVEPDAHPGEGPLGGILTAMAAACTDVVVVLACDLPGVTARSVEAVVAALAAHPEAGASWPELDGHAHVLHAAWRRSVARGPLAAAFAAGERSPRRASSTIARVVPGGIAPGALRNVNRPADLQRGEAPMGGATTVNGHNGWMPDPTRIPEVDIAALAEAHTGGAYVLDVRQPDEYEEAHVPGAVLIPLDQLGQRVGEVPRDRPLYVICRSGGRSAAAVEALRGAGYDATNVGGGTLAWMEAGRPTVSGPDAGER